MEATRAIGGNASPGAGGERDTIEGREPNQTPDREKEVARTAKAVDRNFGLSKPHLRTEFGVGQQVRGSRSLSKPHSATKTRAAA